MLDADVAATLAARGGDAGWVTVGIKSICSSQKAIAPNIDAPTCTVSTTRGVNVPQLNVTDRIEGDVAAVVNGRTRVESPSNDALLGSQENIAAIGCDVACGNLAVPRNTDRALIARDIDVATSTVTTTRGIDVAQLNISDRIEGDVATIANRRTRVESPSNYVLIRSKGNIAAIGRDVVCGDRTVSTHTYRAVSGESAV